MIEANNTGKYVQTGKCEERFLSLASMIVKQANVDRNIRDIS